MSDAGPTGHTADRLEPRLPAGDGRTARQSLRQKATEPAASPGGAGDALPLLAAEHLRVTFRVSQGPFRRSLRLRAVDDVNLTVAAGETLGLVGESGSGKSTTGRALLRLIEPDEGSSIRFEGTDITHLRQRRLRPLRRHLQMVFQDPYSSLDPSSVVADSIGEPLEVHDGVRGRERDERVAELLEHVGLRRHHLERYPYEFSGGQRQRIAIARAIALNPKLVVLDEAVSALDVSTQNQIINLLEDLRAEFDIAYLFIAHDLSVVRHISDRVAVMYLGHVVEEGPTARVYERPGHPYTEALLSAVPVPDPVTQRGRRRILLPGDLPDPTDPPPGCVFHTRCAYVMEVCRTEIPPTVPMAGGGEAACHLHTSGPRLGGASVTDLPLPERRASPA